MLIRKKFATIRDIRIMKIGEQAPEFALYNTERKKVILTDLRGNNLVLLFFPFAFSSVCTKELCSVRDNIAFYDKLNAKVFGISVDSHYTLARYKQDQNLNFELLSDFNKKTSAAYGSMYEKFGLDMNGVSKRSAFVIDKEGIIRYAEVLENPGEVPNFEQIQTVLNTLD